MKFRQDIQGYRALAVILVMIFHFNHLLLPGGFIGVDIFFVISGYLISGIIIRQTQKGTFRYGQFIINRLKRIAPAYYAMMLLTLVASFFILDSLDYETFLYQFRRTALFLSNQMFASGTDYFGAKTSENGLLHTWSLSIEMQFYLFLPIVFIFVPKRFWKYLFLFMGLLLIAYTEYNLRVKGNIQGMYFSLPARAPEFFFGMAVNFLPSVQKLTKKFANFLGIICIFVILGATVLLSEKMPFPGLLAVPVCAATAFLLKRGDTIVGKVFSNKILVFIGEISYSLYLFHWPVLALFRYYQERYEITLSETVPLLAGIIGLALLSYYYIEQTIRHHSTKRFSLVFASLALVAAGLWMLFFKTTEKTLIIDRKYVSSGAGFDTSNHAQFSGYKLQGDTSVPDDHILLLGDSHGLVMSGFFQKVAKENRFNFVAITTNSVPAIPGVPLDDIEQGYRKDYITVSNAATELIKKSNIIFLVKHFQFESAYFAPAVNNIAKSLKNGQHLVIVTDFPKTDHNPYRKFRSVVRPANFKPETVRFPELPKFIPVLLSENKNVHLLDLRKTDFFNGKPFYKDTLMYYDEFHMNHYGSIHYAEQDGYKLAALIKQLKNR